MLELITYPNDILEQRAERVEEFDEELMDLLTGMIGVMKETGGLGLAANQVGALKRVILVKNSDRTRDVIMINPRIVKRSKKARKDRESCLSFPGRTFLTERPKKITVEFQHYGGEKKMVIADGVTAACVLHETDHLNGRLINRFEEIK